MLVYPLGALGGVSASARSRAAAPTAGNVASTPASDDDAPWLLLAVAKGETLLQGWVRSSQGTQGWSLIQGGGYCCSHGLTMRVGKLGGVPSAHPAAAACPPPCLRLLRQWGAPQAA
eukprot:CAMPEP_0202872278 /NCGR_PEP_ID=MMETSP1391-20130828/20818_1 /ASSEMBLY_ACC=CAM_ASM_000867 /TAXON_ID=1034604 /ORGANISM="Chlamydomonas leiostraca, Strain SAG 11-49" /LENGTH=116 /DNA_ID=CAMNT_0049553281 /DNA_START=365 /DNA_END=716 /DNA_ORIENTATION=-